VTRDRLMTSLALRYGVYGWERNSGYGTPLHLQALAAHGLTPHHRRRFCLGLQVSLQLDDKTSPNVVDRPQFITECLPPRVRA